MLCVHNGSAFRFSSKTEVYVECLAWRAMTAMGRYRLFTFPKRMIDRN